MCRAEAERQGAQTRTESLANHRSQGGVAAAAVAAGPNPKSYLAGSPS